MPAADGSTAAVQAHPYGYGDNGKYGLDCSGFVRWVYFLIYSVPAAQRQPGDLVFFPGHVGIYAGNGVMVDESHTYDPPSGPAGQWTQVYARTDPVGPHVLGYYRVVVPATPTEPDGSGPGDDGAARLEGVAVPVPAGEGAT
jgi:hypothetical protein